MYLLSDPEGLGKTVALPMAAAAAALLLDGRKTAAQVRTELSQRSGHSIPLGMLVELVEQLDAACLLASPRFRSYRQRVLARYLRSPIRPPAHADRCYPRGRRALMATLDACFRAAGIDPLRQERQRPPRVLLAPHIDYARGGPSYAAAYREVAARPSDLYVIFGTAHQSMHQLVGISRKDFRTPLGTARTHRRFIDTVARHLQSSLAGRGLDLFADELAHRREHSIEFQVVFLQHVLRRPAVRIVPILVASFYEFIEEESSPEASPALQALVAALRAAEAASPGKVTYLCSADLAHVGPEFGEEKPLSPQRLRAVEDEDRRLLSAFCAGDAESLFAQVARHKDRNNVCGLSPAWLTLAAAGSVCGRLLDYRQAVREDRSGCVSFAAAVCT